MSQPYVSLVPIHEPMQTLYGFEAPTNTAKQVSSTQNLCHHEMCPMPSLPPNTQHRLGMTYQALKCPHRKIAWLMGFLLHSFVLLCLALF